ncbi:2-dehydropantoate 2-reductase [Deferribacterales bacterium Es71-Z0220]|uniref:2-dehydropantoate 2-reductase n=1 Tax=Deferrivibrio essentukiensis TaxID=2880922 RepID=UPI001F61F4A8|nr:2-dehydropantoate 2-reductase [Deferrivibrio essentukiensis]MCB4205417.1 2-dehydropantoate 2-reductase [Deferrivibrio essentukiensis]
MSSFKKIAVFGAGAVGSFYGSILKKAGHDVTLVARGEHLRKINELQGLYIKSYKLGDFFVDIDAKSELEDGYDIIIISTKSKDTAFACSSVKKYLKEDGYVVSMQNGVDNYKIIAESFGKDSTVVCSVYVGLTVEPYGTVVHSAAGKLVVGGLTDKSKTKAKEFSNLFKHTGIECSEVDNIEEVAWKKLLWNVAFNPLSALLETTCGRLTKNEDSLHLMKMMINECVEAARTDGIYLDEKYKESVPFMIDGLEDYKTSMLQDIEKLRNPEVDGILLPVINRLEGKAYYCDSIYRALSFKYGKKFIYPPKLTVDVIVVNSKKQVLLIERKNKPYGWAIPGGFVDYGETVEQAAVRELLEETSIGISEKELKLLGIYSDPKRDPRGHTVSIVYYAYSDSKPLAADDAKSAKFFELSSLPDNVVFDHIKILNDLKILIK